MNQLLRDNPLARFSRGFLSPFRAGRFLLQHPGLLRFVAIPFVINTVVFVAAVWLGLHFFDATVVHYIPRGEAWYWALLYYFLWLLAVLLTMVLVFFSFTVVGNLIASPFNDLLSERTETVLTGKSGANGFSLAVFFREAGRTLLEESKKILVFLLGMGLLLLLNLLPGPGTLLYGGLSVLWTIFFLVIEYTGYAAARHQLRFREQRRYVLGRKFLMLGFGSGLLCLLAVPFLQFFCIPLGVVGATRLWCEEPPERPEAGEGEG